MKIGFIGTGNMASSIILGLINTGYDGKDIWVTNRTMSKAEMFTKYNINVVDTSEEVIANADLIVLAMKPDGYKPWLDSHAISGKKIISIGAGITSEFMSSYTDNFVITMPNTPSKLGYGSTLIVDSDKVTEEVLNIFKAIGKTHLIKEEELDVYTLVTGCSPAYFFSFVANMSDVLSSQYNLDKQVVEEMLIQVMNGSGAMLKQAPNPKQLCDNVCSPGGITIEVVNHLNNDLPETFKAGFDAAIKRTNEMKN